MHDWIYLGSKKYLDHLILFHLSHHQSSGSKYNKTTTTTTTTIITDTLENTTVTRMISSMIIEILKRPTTDNNDNGDKDHNRTNIVDDPSYTIKVVKVLTSTDNSHSQQDQQLSNVDEDLAATATQKNEVVVHIPVLAFGMYKVPDNDDGVQIVLNAIQCGYRHFDSASIYDNEKTLGKALQTSIFKSKIVKRSELFIASKVWNDVQKDGRDAVRRSVEQSLKDLQIDYLDICYIHWPVPGYFVETYKELILLCNEGKINSIGISNFNKLDYEELLSGIAKDEELLDFIPPLINQFEISPFMYRPDMIQYFQKENGILIAASKALNRFGAGSDREDTTSMKIIQDIATLYSVTYAQILIRWSYQKGYIVLSKTSNILRMKENRNIFGGFCLSDKEMKLLDSITTYNDVRIREELEVQRKMNS